MDCQSNEFSHLKYIVAIIHSYHVRTNLPITNNVVSSNPTQTKFTTLCDKKSLSVTGQWFFPVSSINKTDCHDITEILLKVVLKTINLTTVI